MRNKLKQLMKKEEGFTLVELLAVIVILGIIVAIAIPAVGNIMDRSRTNANAAEEALVIDAARLYFIENDSDEVDAEVPVATLISEGFLEERDRSDEADALTGTVSRTGTSDGAYEYTWDKE